MKKQSIYALMSAIALSGTIGFSSCSSDDKVEVNPNPGYNSSTGDVPVQFVFNVSTNSQGKTRMSAGNVQEGSVPFRGIQNAKLYSFKFAGDGSHVYDPNTQKDRVYDLDMLIDAGGLNPSGTPQSRRVLEMSLPIGTNTLMMWGRAYRQPLNNVDLDALYGGIDYTLGDNLSGFSFKLKPCVPDNGTNDKAALGQYQVLIEKVLNDIVQAKGVVKVLEGDDEVVNKEMAWADYVYFDLTNGTLSVKAKDPSDISDNPVDMSPLGQILGALFVSFNTFKTGGDSDELRNGEGRITAALMGDIYTVLQRVVNANATTVAEKAAQQVANIVISKITSYFTYQQTGSVYTLQWASISTVKANSGLTPENLQKVNDELSGFPDQIFHLPPGATVMKYMAIEDDPEHEGQKRIANKYAFLTNVPTYAMGGGAGGTFNPNNYMYPAELCYFGNSPLRVTDDTHAVNDYPDGTVNWDNDDQWAANVHNNTVAWSKNSHVATSTRSVAMQENINYGTSMLVTTVKYGASELLDNNFALHGEADKSVNVSTGTPFKFTGILIGGQVQEVGWNYIAKSDGTNANFACMVYDNQINDKNIPYYGSGNATQPTYTLVWDNWDPSEAGKDQRKVFVALEFYNDAADFWGMNNLIRKGATFYIVGELDPETGSYGDKPAAEASAEEKAAYYAQGIIWPLATGETADGEKSYYALPPYDNSGNTIKERRVFIQDYKTIANFTLGENALKHALVSVPDLRQSQLSLGLSVDLKWSSGLTFDVTLGGGQ